MTKLYFYNLRLDFTLVICYPFRFKLDDQVTRKKISDYFYEKYEIVLQYPLLPALQAGSDMRPMFIPMEVFLFTTFSVCVCVDVLNNVLWTLC